MHLTPKALEKMSRTAAVQPFDAAAQSLAADWGGKLHGKQVERWARQIGDLVVELREQERKAQHKGRRPEGPEEEPDLLAIGMDGGRVQQRTINPDTQSRWHEDKVLTLSHYTREPAKEKGGDPQPVRQRTTYVATMENSDHFGQLARVEAERCGIRQAKEVVVIGDGGAWIDTVAQTHFACHQRIIDYAHVNERLAASAKALHPVDEKKRHGLAGRLEKNLYAGQTRLLLRWLQKQCQRLGAPRECDPENHPRRVLSENHTYLQRHHMHMDYPFYRSRGWPIGSGVTESGVKLFNKRVKGTEQFWNHRGAESILALRALWLSQDQRWDHYWLYGKLPRMAA